MVQIGNTNMDSSTLADNLDHVNTVLSKRYPGGWKNIRAQHIKSETSMAIPVYANTRKYQYISTFQGNGECFGNPSSKYTL